GKIEHSTEAKRNFGGHERRKRALPASLEGKGRGQKRCKKEVVPLTDGDIRHLAAWLNIPNFRGVFMRDSLPETRGPNESGVVNLDESSGTGSHWTAYWVDGEKRSYFFDPIGDSSPPPELERYLDPLPIYYNSTGMQEPFKDQPFCGHLCLI